MMIKRDKEDESDKDRDNELRIMMIKRIGIKI